jgi:hypothetical protein
MNEKMCFGQALDVLKHGGVIARKCWNGKGMFIYLNKGSRDVSDDSHDKLKEGAENVEGIPFELFEMGDKGTVTRLPNINMKNAANRTVTGWLASQTDMLAEDWIRLEMPVLPSEAEQEKLARE